MNHASQRRFRLFIMAAAVASIGSVLSLGLPGGLGLASKVDANPTGRSHGTPASAHPFYLHKTTPAALDTMIQQTRTFVRYWRLESAAQASLAGMRKAALHGDRSLIPAMIQVLQQTRHPMAVETALHSLAELRATEALPVMEALALDPAYSERSFALVARAQLLAESSSNDIADGSTRAAAKINRFYAEIGVTPAELSAVAARFRALSGPINGPQPPEIYAIRALSDMIYRDPQASYNSLAGVAGVDFTQDHGALLKMKLAPMTQEQKIDWIVKDLANKKVVSFNEYFEMQLAADEGLPASRAVMAQLKVMDTDRTHYSEGGFAALFELLGAFDNPEQGPLIGHFQGDADPKIAWYAKYVMGVYQFAEGY